MSAINSNYPAGPSISRSLAGKLVVKFAENGSIQDLLRQGLPCVSEEVKLDVLLEAVEKSHYFTRQLALNYNVVFFCGEII